MATKTIKTGMLYRSVEFIRDAVNDEKRTVDLSASSELPVDRWFGKEILDHSPGSVDMSRMNSGASLLVGHNQDDQVGVIENAKVEDRKLKATVRFGKSNRAQEIFNDVKDGIRRLVSIGYRVNRMDLDSKEGSLETYRATNWTPYEVSLVSVPADPTVGVGRGADETTITLINMPETTIAAPAAPAPAPTVNVEEVRKQIQKDAGEILSMGKKFNCIDDASRAIQEGKSVDQFRCWVLENKFDAKPVNTSPDIGMSRKDIRSWSMVRAIRMAHFGKLDGIEKEASDSVAKICRRETEGFFIPNEIMHGHPDTRDLSATGGGNVGGYTIQTDVLGGSLIELLRNLTVALNLGARKLGGLQGNVAIPSQSAGATAYWVSENAQTTSSNLTFGSITLNPHRLSAVTLLGKQLLAQSTVDVEALVREDFARVLAIAIDKAALNGAGANGEPLGIINTTGIGSETFGAAASWAKILDFETQVSNANALLGSLAYVTTPSARAKLKAAAKIGTTFPVFIWEDKINLAVGVANPSSPSNMPGEGSINGYRAVATKQVPGDKMLFGNWSDLILADWIGMDVITDPYTKADTHQIKVTVNMLADIGIRHVGSFSASTDSAAQ